MVKNKRAFSIIQILANHTSKETVRNLVRRLHGDPSLQREAALDGVRRALCLSADGVFYARNSLKPFLEDELIEARHRQEHEEEEEENAAAAASSHKEKGVSQDGKDAGNQVDPMSNTAANSNANRNSTAPSNKRTSAFFSNFFLDQKKSTSLIAEELLKDLPPSEYYLEVGSERGVIQNFFPNRILSGINVGVSDTLDARNFYTRHGVDSILLKREGKDEMPLLQWMRAQGATVVGKLRCQTPLALYEGSEFGPEKPIAAAVRSGSAHYVITTSMASPAALTACVTHDLVGFKPTSQTISTFSQVYRRPLPSASIGVAAAKIDDLLFLWQAYTSALDLDTMLPESSSNNYKGNKTSKNDVMSSSTSTTTEKGEKATISSDNDNKSKEAVEEGNETTAQTVSTTTNSNTTAEDTDAAKKDTPTAGEDGDKNASAAAAAENTETDTIANMKEGDTNRTKEGEDAETQVLAPVTTVERKDNISIRNQHGAYLASRQSVVAKSSINKGVLADIDVGWKDYNAEGMGGSADLHLYSATARAKRFRLPSMIRRLLVGEKEESELWSIPRIELAIGYPAEWVSQYCSERYGDAATFHRRLTEFVYYRSTLSKSQKIEILPLSFDFSLEDVKWACEVITQYETVKKMEALYEDSHRNINNAGDNSSNNSNNGQRDMNSLKSIEAFIKEMPPIVIDTLAKGQQISDLMYANAWRIRDDVVRSTGELFQDVDAFVIPLLARPYHSGSLDTNLLTLPFYLAGHPMLSMQMGNKLPIALVGELGRDAALLEDSLRFMQFVRGDAPSWWRRKMFGVSKDPLSGGDLSQPQQQSDAANASSATVANSVRADTAREHKASQEKEKAKEDPSPANVGAEKNVL